MVLVKNSLTFLAVIAVVLLNACSTHSLNRPAATKPDIIPVQSETLDPILTKPSPAASPIKTQKRANTEQTPTEKDQAVELKSGETMTQQTPSKTDSSVLEVLLEKTQKAIDLQQWLRAQRSLEQAIRLAPTEAKIFLLYGDVYSKLGIPEKAQQMYKRAIYLSASNNEIAGQAQEALAELVKIP